MSVKIDIHADDFGESAHASRDILECLKDGKLNSISVLANMSCFEEFVRLYREAREEFQWQPAITDHENLGEAVLCFLSSVQKQVQKTAEKRN